MNRKLLIGVFALIILSISGCGTKEKTDLTDQETADTVLAEAEVSKYDFDVIKSSLKEMDFESIYKGYFIAVAEDDSFSTVSITNYDPEDIKNQPEYQELIEYGNSGMSDGFVYSINIMQGKDDYTVEYNPITEEVVYESGEFFLKDDKEKFLKEKLDMLKYVLEYKK